MNKEAVVKIKEILTNAGIEFTDKEYDKFIQTYENLPYYKDGMEIRRDNVLFVYASQQLASIQYSKEGAYADSWAKRKEIGVFSNVARKFDRVEAMIVDGRQDEVGETKLDTIGDMSTYGVLWVTLFLREQPEVFKKWIRDTVTK